MTPPDWAAFILTLTALFGTLTVTVRHLVKHYLSELRPNGGTSLKDKVNQLDEKVEFLTEFVLQALKK